VKYRELPLEKELEDLRRNSGDAAMDLERSSLLDSLIRHRGFQIIVILLRDIERSALHNIRYGHGVPDTHARIIRTVEYIRRAINEIVPKTQVDWADEELEEFMPPDIADF
jgi:hypothetical protein